MVLDQEKLEYQVPKISSIEVCEYYSFGKNVSEDITNERWYDRT